MTADAQRRLRLRRAGLLPPLPTCPDCGRQMRSTRNAPLCSRCWKRTPAGREANRLRMHHARIKHHP
jgi:predicted amidophosphoribosyltransferase